MESIPEPLEFEWDEGNRDKNWEKHLISNKEAEEVFINEPLLVYEDAKHSDNEKRFQCLGKTNNNKRLFISFTLRSNKIRVISARLMNQKERKIYEKTQSNSKI